MTISAGTKLGRYEIRSKIGDGKRFLVASLPEAPQRQQINVIVNWLADLKR